MTDVIIGSKQKEKLVLRVWSRTLGQIASHTLESKEDVVNKFYPDRSTVIHIIGSDEFDQAVDHYWEIAGKGDIGLVVVVPLKDRKVVPVEAQVTQGPRRA